MNTIFFNGCIRTLDNSEKVAEAVGIENGRIVFGRIQCLSPAKKYKLYKSSINKSIHFVQKSLSSSPRGQRVTAQFNLSRE